MVFPCIYPDCSTKLIWSRVQQHEIECVYRTMPCPNIDCETVILCSKLIEHFNECHKPAIISDVAGRFHKLDNYFDLGLLVYDGNPFICVFESNGKTFKANVYSMRNLITQKFTIDLYTLTFQKRKISISGEKIELFNDKLHCVRCYLGKCTSKLHWRSLYPKMNKLEFTTVIDVESIRSILKSETVCSKITIEVSKQLQDMIDNSDVIRRITECMVCKEYMSSPIHFCQTGHIICLRCEKNVSKCPTCSAPFLSARNYAIEELCSNVVLLCQNKTCNFVSGLKDMYIHEENCDAQDTKPSTEFKEKVVWNFI